MIKIENAYVGQRVEYSPGSGLPVEAGVVSAVTDSEVMVKFLPGLERFGWTRTQGFPCEPTKLTPVAPRWFAAGWAILNRWREDPGGRIYGRYAKALVRCR